MANTSVYAARVESFHEALEIACGRRNSPRKLSVKRKPSQTA